MNNYGTDYHVLLPMSRSVFVIPSEARDLTYGHSDPYVWDFSFALGSLEMTTLKICATIRSDIAQ